MAVDAVAFDFGGVVIRTPFEMAAGLEERLDLPRGSIDLAGPFDPDADPLWRRFRAGEFTELEYWHRQADRHAELIGAGPDRLRSFIDALFDAPQEEVIRLNQGRSLEAMADASSSCESAVLMTAATTPVRSRPSTMGWKKTEETTR